MLLPVFNLPRLPPAWRKPRRPCHAVGGPASLALPASCQHLTPPFSLWWQALGLLFCSYSFELFPTSGSLSCLLCCPEHSYVALHMQLPSHFIIRVGCSLTPNHSVTFCPSLISHHRYRNCLPYKCINLFITHFTRFVCKFRNFRNMPV